MNRRVKCVWRTYMIEVILVFFVLVLLVPLIFFTDRDWLSPSDTIQTITFVVLVIVTGYYAWSTHKIYKVASNAERNAVFPIVSIAAEVTNLDHIVISYENIGRGPALNLRIWLEREGEDQFWYLKSEAKKNEGFRAAVGVSRKGRREWDNSEEPLPTLSSGFDIVAEYTDVFGQGFESKLVIVDSNDQEFFFGKKKEQ